MFLYFADVLINLEHVLSIEKYQDDAIYGVRVLSALYNWEEEFDSSEKQYRRFDALVEELTSKTEKCDAS